MVIELKPSKVGLRVYRPHRCLRVWEAYPGSGGLRYVSGGQARRFTEVSGDFNRLQEISRVLGYFWDVFYAVHESFMGVLGKFIRVSEGHHICKGFK